MKVITSWADDSSNTCLFIGFQFPAIQFGIYSFNHFPKHSAGRNREDSSEEVEPIQFVSFIQM